MTEKLTPRVGDRVIVPSGAISPVTETVCGIVRAIDPCTGADAQVQTDRGSWIWVRFAELTVVDREPVEWPEGWKRWGDDVVFVTLNRYGAAIRRDFLLHILATGPDMLARWDELMGEQ